MGKKKKQDKIKKNMQINILLQIIQNLPHFILVIKTYPFIENANDKSELRINIEELNKLNEIIMIMRTKLNLAKSNNNFVEIIPEFKTHFQEIKIFDDQELHVPKK